MGTAKFFTLLLLLYRTLAKSQGMKQLMAGGGVALIGTKEPDLAKCAKRERFWAGDFI
ncbi:MAG: Maff2 family mobile element protein [Blautia wexlerae]